MDKLYYIVCEEKGETLFEGRFQGRTRGAAMKFLKDQIERPSLNGTVFTVTEIPVPLIREIVQAIMKGEEITGTMALLKKAEPTKPARFDAFESKPQPPVEAASTNGLPAENTDWKMVRKFYRDCRSPKTTADQFGLSINTVKARIRREAWAA
jgi:hypothetical protein